MPIKSSVGKSTLSMYLRTNCDRELYFSLFKSSSASDLISSGMPASLSARPNIQLVTQQGRDFEEQEFDMLVSEMGISHMKFDTVGAKKYADLDLYDALQSIPTPGFCIQPAVDPEHFRQDFLCNDFGISITDE